MRFAAATILFTTLTSAATALTYDQLYARSDDDTFELYLRAEEAFDEYLSARALLEARGTGTKGWDVAKAGIDGIKAFKNNIAEKRKTEAAHKDALKKLEGKKETPGITQAGLDAFAAGPAGDFARKQRQGRGGGGGQAHALAEWPTQQKRDVDDWDLYFE